MIALIASLLVSANPPICYKEVCVSNYVEVCGKPGTGCVYKATLSYRGKGKPATLDCDYWRIDGSDIYAYGGSFPDRLLRTFCRNKQSLLY